jgi:hypothetical protein
MANLTVVVALAEIIIGIVAVLVPSIGIDSTVASGLVALGLSTLGIRNAIASQSVQVGNVKGIW